MIYPLSIQAHKLEAGMPIAIYTTALGALRDEVVTKVTSDDEFTLIHCESGIIYVRRNEFEVPAAPANPADRDAAILAAL